MSLQQYRLADLAVLGVLAFLASLVSELAFRQVTHSLVYVNFGLLIGIIAIVRWNAPGTLMFVLAGVPVFLFRQIPGDFWFQFGFYILANAGIGFSVVLFRYLKKDSVGTTFLGSLAFLSCVYILLVFFKTSSALAFRRTLRWVARCCFHDGIAYDRHHQFGVFLPCPFWQRIDRRYETVFHPCARGGETARKSNPNFIKSSGIFGPSGKCMCF
ncbi:MAG: hypothetical protein MZU97_26285 [Bacillus subtilis]|nr:hypothetical protein [Bacillus subtilis]